MKTIDCIKVASLTFLVSAGAFAGQRDQPHLVQMQKVDGLEVSLVLPSNQAAVGQPFRVKLIVKNVSNSAITLGYDSSFLKTVKLTIFNLTESTVVPLTLYGMRERERDSGKYREIVIKPDKSVVFSEPMLGWLFDLSIPADYRLELQWLPGTVYARPPEKKFEPATLAGEFTVVPAAGLSQALIARPETP